jgi:guanosine-3',5'-bis(diphosphate) 3'-pyrophosphohydrolase
VSYFLKVYNNFHYMDEDETYFVKGIGTAEEALRKARGMVESYFLENWKPGIDYGTANAMYTMYGLDPVICSDSGENVKFSAWKYAGEIAMPIVMRLELNNVSTQRLYQLVLKYVAEKHISQKVPGTELPYLVHLSNVAMEILLTASHSKGFDLNFALKVALLHDVLEDNAATKEEISFIYGDSVKEAVLSLTKNSELAKEERMMDSLNRIKTQPYEVWAVKMADRITNLQPPPKDWSNQKRKEYTEEATLIYDQLNIGNSFLAARLKSSIEEYKKFDEKSLTVERGDR